MLKKHMNTKNIDQKCKACYKVFPKSMDALIHTAKEYGKNIIQDTPKINELKDKDIGINNSAENIDIYTKIVKKLFPWMINSTQVRRKTKCVSLA